MSKAGQRRTLAEDAALGRDALLARVRTKLTEHVHQDGLSILVASVRDRTNVPLALGENLGDLELAHNLVQLSTDSTRCKIVQVLTTLGASGASMNFRTVPYGVLGLRNIVRACAVHLSSSAHSVSSMSVQRRK